MRVVFFSFIMFVCSFYLPESPRWLLLKGNRQKAILILNKTRVLQEDIDLEFSEVKKNVTLNQYYKYGFFTQMYFWKIIKPLFPVSWAELIK